MTLSAIAGGTRLSRGRRSRSVVGIERLQGRRGRVKVKRDLLLDHVISNLVEGREWHAACDHGSKMIIPLVQPLKNIEDEVAVRYCAAEVT
jgi:hypothetical protein